MCILEYIIFMRFQVTWNTPVTGLTGAVEARVTGLSYRSKIISDSPTNGSFVTPITG